MFGRKTDEELITAALAGTESAWQSLVRRYEKRLYNHALRMVGNQEDAMDLLQDVLLSIYRNLRNFRGDAPFINWAFRITTFRCTDYLRKKKLATDEFEDAGDEALASNPAATFESARSNSEIIELLAMLPLDQRQVIELKFCQNFTFDEIASQLGISSNTAKSRLYAALKRMRGLDEAQALAC